MWFCFFEPTGDFGVEMSKDFLILKIVIEMSVIIFIEQFGQRVSKLGGLR